MRFLILSLLLAASAHAAPIVVEEFSEIAPECASCVAFAETRAQIRQRYGDKVQVVFKHFPQPQTPRARLASEASLCARESGGAKFWQFVDAAMRDSSLDRAAKSIGLGVGAFQKCMKESRYANEVKADSAEADKLGVMMVPTAVIDGKMVATDAVIETLDKKLGVTRPPAPKAEETVLRENTPPDVLSYFDEVENCAHWANEEPYAPETVKQARLTCSTLRKNEGELRAKYKAKGEVIKKIERFDELSGAKEYSN